MDDSKWIRRLEREKKARKEAEKLLEEKSLELWNLNQGLEKEVIFRTKELQKALDEAKTANLAKDNFLANMSHEIRTPLNAIIGFVDIMLRKKHDEVKFEKYLRIIQQSGNNLLHIINDILDLSKIQSGKYNIDLTETNIETSLRNTVSLHNSKAKEKQINYNLSFSKNFPSLVLTDETRVTQVVSNFISNSIKFTPENGTIDIKFLFDENSFLTFQVIDNGIGIEKEKHEIIFTPFEQEDSTTTKSYGGTGLGLSISKSLIELLDGKLLFSSEKGLGSMFGFIIPMEIIK